MKEAAEWDWTRKEKITDIGATWRGGTANKSDFISQDLLQ
jgi:hypothetical protein